MADALWTQPRFEVTVLQRRRRRAPARRSRRSASLSLLPSFVTYRPLGVAAKAAVARALRRLGALRSWRDVRRLVARHAQGREAVAGFWQVFVVPAVNAGLDEVSAADALFVVRTAFAGEPEAARIGWSRVPLAHIAGAAAARAASVRLRTGVVALVEDGGDVAGCARRR